MTSIGTLFSELSTNATQIQFWICVAAGALLVVLLARPRDASGWVGRAFLVLGIVAAATYLTSRQSFLHRWDLFHTLVTSKYFEEVGYFGIYESAVAVDAEANQLYDDVDRVRDLRTLTYTSRDEILADGRATEAFDEKRKAEFAADLRAFYEINPKRWHKLFQDKGYNGTPLYTFVSKAAADRVPFSRTGLTGLALIDVALLALAFLAVAWGFGARTCVIALTFFCVNFPNRFVHMGGAFLRFDYIAFLMIGVACMRKQRHGAAGALLALATMERIFPGVFVAGYGVKAAVDSLANRRIERRHLRFAASFGVTLVACFALTLTLPDAWGVWRDFIDNMSVHNQASAGFRIGLKHLFMLDGNLTGSDGFVPYATKELHFQARAVPYWICVAALGAGVLFAVRRLDEASFSIVFGLVAFFALTVATRYYYSVLVLVFLLGIDPVRQRGYGIAWIAMFAISAVAFQARSLTSFDPFLYNTLFSCSLAAFLIGFVAYLGAGRAPLAFDEPPGGETSFRAMVSTGWRAGPWKSAAAWVALLVVVAVLAFGQSRQDGPEIEADPIGPLAAPELAPEVLSSIASTVDALVGDPAGVPRERVPRELHGTPAMVYLALRSRGTLVGSTWSTTGSWHAAIDDATRRIVEPLSAAKRDTIDSAEIVLASGFEAVDDSTGSGSLTNVHRGVLGLEVHRPNAILRVAPTTMLATNRSFDRQLEVIAEDLGIDAPELRRTSTIRTFEAKQVLVTLGEGAGERGATEMFRGNRLVGLGEVTRSSVEALAERMTEWLLRNVGDDGRMTYKYWPSRGEESTSNNMIRQWMATVALDRIAELRGDERGRAAVERNLDYNLEHFYSREDGLGLIEFDGKVKLGAVALAGLAIVEHHRRSEYEEQETALRLTIDSLWRESGSFRTYYKPEDRRGQQNFYPGEALLFWATLFRESGDPDLLRRIMASFAFYRSWHLANRNPAFVPWHTQAYYLVWEETRDPELRDWIFEMNDWLLGVQELEFVYEDTEGRFYDASRPFGPPHASSTGVYLEGLIDAFALARQTGDPERAERYRRSILLGIRSSMQLEFADALDMFYVSKRDRIRGALRSRVYDNEVRVDNVQHTLMALQKILRVFRDDDFESRP